VAAKSAKKRATSPVLPQIQYRRISGSPPAGCWCGTVDAASLNAPTASQDVPMIGGLGANFRLEHVLIRETSRFSSPVVSRLAVSAKTGSGIDIISEFALQSETAPQNFAYVLPAPVALTGTYDLVLNFTGSAPLAIDGSSNFSSGSISWEVCGYQVR
jgi:hypothetical protein